MHSNAWLAVRMSLRLARMPRPARARRLWLRQSFSHPLLFNIIQRNVLYRRYACIAKCIRILQLVVLLLYYCIETFVFNRGLCRFMLWVVWSLTGLQVVAVLLLGTKIARVFRKSSDRSTSWWPLLSGIDPHTRTHARMHTTQCLRNT